VSSRFGQNILHPGGLHRLILVNLTSDSPDWSRKICTRRTWIAKIDDTTHSIRQALNRALSQKQTSAQATADRMGQLEQRLSQILQAESHLLALKEQIETTLI
jgi:hypothetical protein